MSLRILEKCFQSCCRLETPPKRCCSGILLGSHTSKMSTIFSILPIFLILLRPSHNVLSAYEYAQLLCNRYRVGRLMYLLRCKKLSIGLTVINQIKRVTFDETIPQDAADFLSDVCFINWIVQLEWCCQTQDALLLLLLFFFWPWFCRVFHRRAAHTRSSQPLKFQMFRAQSCCLEQLDHLVHYFLISPEDNITH